MMKTMMMMVIPCCSLICGGGIHEESVDAKQEDKVAPRQVLQAFKQQIFHLHTWILLLHRKHLEFIEPKSIDCIDEIEKKVSPQTNQNQRLS